MVHDEVRCPRAAGPRGWMVAVAAGALAPGKVYYMLRKERGGKREGEKERERNVVVRETHGFATSLKHPDQGWNPALKVSFH